MSIRYQRLTPSQQKRIEALSEALSSVLKYGDEGLSLAIQMLDHEKGQIKLTAYDLLWEKLDFRAKKQLLQHLDHHE